MGNTPEPIIAVVSVRNQSSINSKREEGISSRRPLQIKQIDELHSIRLNKSELNTLRTQNSSLSQQIQTIKLVHSQQIEKLNSTLSKAANIINAKEVDDIPVIENSKQ